MKTSSTILGALTVGGQVIGTKAFAFKLINKTGVNIYVWTESNGLNCGKSTTELCTSTQQVLANDAAYTSPYTLAADSAGLTIKAAWSPAQSPPGPNYEIECSKVGNALWYDFSHEAGNVFHDVARTLSGSGCPTLHCNAGDDSCDWYACNGGDCNVKTCALPAELVATIGQ